MKILLLVSLLFLSLMAQVVDFESCAAKIKDSNAITNDSLQIPLSDNRLLIYSKTKPIDLVILKEDEKLGLYIVEDKNGFEFPFKFGSDPLKDMASVNATDILEGRFVSVDGNVTFDPPPLDPSLILTSCCNLEALVFDGKIITKEQILSFINPPKLEPKKETSLKAEPKKAEPKKDQAKIKPPTKAKLEPKKEVLNIVDGIIFDNSLRVIAINDSAKHYGLKLGDRLLQVNFKDVLSFTQVKEALKVSPANLLFLRNGFQFFVKLD